MNMSNPNAIWRLRLVNKWEFMDKPLQGEGDEYTL